MAGARARIQQMAQQQFQQMAMQIIDGMDVQHDVFVERTLRTLRELKAGEIDLSQLVVTDTDYEVMPKKPEIARKSA